jgi:hypothetical protein
VRCAHGRGNVVALAAAFASLVVAVVNAGFNLLRERGAHQANRELSESQAALEVNLAHLQSSLERETKREEREAG